MLPESDNSGLRFDDRLADIASRVAGMTRAQRAVIVLRQESGLAIAAASGPGTLDINALGASVFVANCFDQAEVLVCDDTEIDSRVVSAACREHNLRSMVAVPVQSQQPASLASKPEILGVVLALAGTPHHFGADKVRLVQTLATIVGDLIQRMPKAALAPLQRKTLEVPAEQAETAARSEPRQSIPAPSSPPINEASGLESAWKPEAAPTSQVSAKAEPGLVPVGEDLRQVKGVGSSPVPVTPAPARTELPHPLVNFPAHTSAGGKKKGPALPPRKASAPAEPDLVATAKPTGSPAATSSSPAPPASETKRPEPHAPVTHTPASPPAAKASAAVASAAPPSAKSRSEVIYVPPKRSPVPSTLAHYATPAPSRFRTLVIAGSLVVIAALALTAWRLYRKNEELQSKVQASTAVPPALPATAPASPEAKAQPNPAVKEPAKQAKTPSGVVPDSSRGKNDASKQPKISSGESAIAAQKPTSNASVPATHKEAPVEPLVIRSGTKLDKTVEEPAVAPPIMAATPASLPVLPGSTARPPSGPPVAQNAVIVPASLIRKVTPAYPPLAARLQVRGSVKLRANVLKDGKVGTISAISGNQMLQTAAIAAVKQWIYKPATRNGEPVESTVVVEVDFTR